MKRLRILLACVVLAVGLIGPALVIGAEAGKLPPEKTYSNMPFLHRIYLRDENENLINAPKPADPKATGEGERAKPFSTAMTCGKCHAYPTMSHGWHFNSWEKDVPAGRAGEPWMLTDVQTRTTLPLSYRGWKGTYRPHDVGINDYNFVKMFGRHLPGGSAGSNSADLRFRMSGKFEIDCMICHSIQPYDHAERFKQLSEFENFKYAPSVASLLGNAVGKASALKDNWDPNDPDARKPPKVDYRPERFDSENFVTFQVTRRVGNDKCYFCHTSIDVGRAEAGQKALESRWSHDRDIHLAKGMLCVDCHRNGVDHMIARGYEGEVHNRKVKDETIATLTCRGCHYAENGEGGRLAAPRPVHKGLPTLHFDKIACTTCHSGPLPGEQTTNVQTSLAHRLGLPRHHRGDDMAPKIQQAVFLKDESDPMGRIAPHKMVYPSFWARLSGDKVTPIPPQDVVGAGTGSILGAAPKATDDFPFKPLTKEEVLKVLEKLAAAKGPSQKLKAADAVMGFAKTVEAHAVTAPATTQATTAPASKPAEAPATPPWYIGEPVYITGGKLYKRTADGKDLQAVDHEAARPYAWALAHDVRSAQRALGAVNGCKDCHSFGAPLFDGKVASDSVLAGAGEVKKMTEVRGESMGALWAFAATYPMRPILVATGYICAVLLGLILLSYGCRAVAVVSRRK